MLSAKRIRVTIVVLGDVGYSPRMQYHALALAGNLADVDVVGQAGSAVHRTVRAHTHIRFHFLRPPLLKRHHRLPHALFLGYALLRTLSQSLQLLWVLLFRVRKPDFLLVQNPPAVPTLLVTLIVARVRSAKLVIDWHNLAYTMLSLQLGPRHPLVRLARWYEGALGRRADAHFCVSGAMQEALAERWNIQHATVLYDRPADVFAPTPLPARRDLFRRLRDRMALHAVPWHLDAPDRPVMIVSATSWTADEDFGVLLEAAVQCEELIRAHDAGPTGRPFPQLLIIITGQGPLRAYYAGQMARLTLCKIHLRTLWLSPEDYPLLLGAADLGLCLHRSSSGLDLPMKVADMLGSGLPVCALDYGPCLSEVVRHGDNGLLFSTSTQLATLLYDVFKGFPDDTPLLNHLRCNVVKWRAIRWSDGWAAHALPTFTRR
jgi:beta-1,4-mannosyltransferase